MELKINGNIISKVIIKSENKQWWYKIIKNENTPDNELYGVLKTHPDNDDKVEILDYFDYKNKEEAESFVNNECEKAEKNGFEIIREILSDSEPVLKHYIFTDESSAITYEDDYSTIEEAQAFNDLLIKQFGKKFTFHEV